MSMKNILRLMNAMHLIWSGMNECVFALGKSCPSQIRWNMVT